MYGPSPDMGTDQQDTTCTSKDSHGKMTERSQMSGPRALLLFTIASFPRFCGCFLCKIWAPVSNLQNFSGNFQERKLSRISRFCGYLGKFSLQNLGTSEQSAKNFPMKILFSTKSSPAKFTVTVPL